jgi:hypothetical protein
VIGYLIGLVFTAAVGAIALSMLVAADAITQHGHVRDSTNAPPYGLIIGSYTLLLLALWGGVHTLWLLMAWL